jgi:hypothetical protein
MDVVRAKPGLGLDCDEKITAAVAAKLFAAGFQSAARYVPLPGNASMGDLDVVEASAILTAGLDLRAVQHAHAFGWVPTAALGQQDAECAVLAAKAAEYLTGATLWCDFEGVRVAAVDGSLAYLCAWAAIVAASDFRAGLYVGTNVPLTSQQLYNIPDFEQYWQGIGVTTAVAKRGYSVVQLQPSISFAGLVLDVDVTTGDMLGDFPQDVSSWSADVPTVDLNLEKLR